jgi:hypothetical protein
MNREDYLAFHESFCARARELSARKNSDYAGSGGELPFANFTRVEHLGIASTEQGFLTRMMDKFCRLITFCRDGKLAVTNESAEDTLLDLVNYSCLLAAYLREKADTGVTYRVDGVLPAPPKRWPRKARITGKSIPRHPLACGTEVIIVRPTEDPDIFEASIPDGFHGFLCRQDFEFIDEEETP